MHRLIVGTFRHPVLYSLEFDITRKEDPLRVVATHKATGGHSWLHLNDTKDTLYCTGWTKPPSLAAYRLSESESGIQLDLLNQAYPKYLSGYVTANKHALYSASGPQGDVFSLDSATGAFATSGDDDDVEPIQRFSFLREEERQAIEQGENIGGIMDFGGLRHGGHSADLSPDGNRLYIADIGRNAIWTYLLNPPACAPRQLTLGSKTISNRPNDGPRHVWPCQVGGGTNKVIYVVQEHSSYVDVFEHEKHGDGTLKPDLVWKQGVNILPWDADCTLYWADEVRTSPSGNVLFASTRGLEPSEKGYVIAVPLDTSTGYMIPTSPSTTDIEPMHRWQTPTSGGWANAISVCPTLGPDGEVFMCLTDSEQGWVWILRWTREDGFAIVGSMNLNEVDAAKAEGDIGASVAVWLD